MTRTLRTLVLLTLLAVSGCIRLPVTIDHVNASTSSPEGLLFDAIGARRLVLIGEMHGTQETPALVGDLVADETRAGKHAVLALEITSLDQPLVDRFMASRGTGADIDALRAGAHWQKPMHDGRDSQAMLALVERMRALRHRGADVTIDLFDQAGSGERNRRMADHLRAVFNHDVLRSPDATMIVLTGNVHAMTSTPPWTMTDNGKPIEPPMTAGRFLADLRPLSINVDAVSGAFWTCMASGCGIQKIAASDNAARGTLRYTTPAESAWNVTLMLPHFTASPPVEMAKTTPEKGE